MKGRNREKRRGEEIKRSKEKGRKLKEGEKEQERGFGKKMKKRKIRKGK